MRRSIDSKKERWVYVTLFEGLEQNITDLRVSLIF